MERRMSIKQLICDIICIYYKELNLSPRKIDIFIEEDMCKKYIELRPDHAKKFPEQMADLNKYSGTTVPPKQLENDFSIIIQSGYFFESFSHNAEWIGTIIHEITHVEDFILFAKLADIQDYDEILDINKNWMFLIWTEFNAKAKGYYYEKKFSYKDIHDKGHLDYIVKQELLFQVQELVNKYYSENNAFRQMYIVAHFLGRLFVWEKLFPEYFTENKTKEIIGDNIWMFDVYTFFRSHVDLEMAYKDFCFLKEIIRQNFKGDF